MFRLIKGDKPDETKLEKMARGFSHPALQSMTDMSLNECGRALLHYTQEGDPRFLHEAEEAAVALLTSIRELRARRDPGRSPR